MDSLQSACSEYVDLERRRFLVKTGLAAAATVTATAGLPRVALGSPLLPSRDILVLMFMRGGLDALTLCAPYGDPDLYNRRPTLAIRPPGQTDGAIDLDGFFGLAPAAQPLLAPYQAGDLAFVHAVGSPDPTRSHFSAQKVMEAGTPNQPGNSVPTGWLARHLIGSAPTGNGLVRGISIDFTMPRALQGAPATLPINDLGAFEMPGDLATMEKRRRALHGMYLNQGAPIGPAALDTFETIDLLGAIDFAHYVPQNGAAYPATEFGNRVRSVAALIKADVGVECVEIDLLNWDMHAGLGPINGSMAQLTDQLARALAALHADLGNVALRRVTVVVMSEFGRRAAENGTSGTDHGHGGLMILMGGHIVGGRVHCQWPGLALPQLDDGDVAVTYDYRDILAEVLERRMGCTTLPNVFPNFGPTFRGVTY